VPEYIGPVAIPVPSDVGSFPFASDFPAGQVIQPEIITHVFESANRKITQRFYKGDGARRFRVRRKRLTPTNQTALKTLWENAKGPYSTFSYSVPQATGSPVAYSCRFADQSIEFEHMAANLASIGVVLVEVPSATPSYSVSSTLTRFPNSTVNTETLNQVQTVIPLLKIRVRDGGVSDIYLSDRRCTVGGNLYQPRLLDWSGIGQSINEPSDGARFVLGNADRVFTLLANQVALKYARVEFSLYFPAITTKVDLWAAVAMRPSGLCEDRFTLECGDPIRELTRAYPLRTVDRACWKDFNDGKHCPFSTAGSLASSPRTIRWSDEDGIVGNKALTVAGSGSSCDKGYDTPNGCLAHSMERYFGGVIARPQGVNTKDNSSGVFGFGRSAIRSVSLVADSAYGAAIPEVYTDVDIPVKAQIIAGRDEGDFYTGLGLVCEGPVTFGTDLTKQILDGQTPHDPQRNGGWRYAQGFDPALAQDKMGITQAPWGILTNMPDVWSGGTAFTEIRRTDAKGLQLTRLSEHDMQVVISQGMGCWTWTAPGSRSWTSGCINPFWIAVNVYLRAIGMKIYPGQESLVTAADMEAQFDCQAAIDAAAIASTSVAALVGGGSETQFTFRGVLSDRKPVRQWLQEILDTGLGYFTFAFGKFRVGARINSSAVQAFTQGNIIADSLRLEVIEPAFNRLTVSFGDKEYKWARNTASYADIDHAKLVGGNSFPTWLDSELTLAGVSTKSQALRLASVRTREELGGINATEWRKARRGGFRTTILALAVEPGMVVSVDHPDVPDTTGEFRVQNWRLNSDYSIDLDLKTTTDSMYDLTVGPKPADVTADPVPGDPTVAPQSWNYDVSTPGDGSIHVRNLQAADRGGVVSKMNLQFYLVDESQAGYCRVNGGINSSSTTLNWDGYPLAPGQYIQVENEIMLVTKAVATAPNFGTATVIRGQLGTTAVAHSRASSTVVSHSDRVVVNVNTPTGGVFRTGNRFFLDLGGGSAEQVEIGAVAGNALTLAYQLTNTPAGSQACYSDPRVWPISRQDRTINLQPRFFTSANRAEFEEVFNFPSQALVFVVADLETTTGARTAEIWTTFPDAHPFRTRLGGNHGYELVWTSASAGDTLNAFEPLRVVETGPVRRAYLKREASTNIHPPRALSNIGPGNYAHSGTITLGGTVAPGGKVAVTVGDVKVTTWSVNTETTTAQAATALATYLNAEPVFAQFYRAEANSNVVRITDLRSRGGTIAVQVGGAITATAAGLTSALGVLTGRKYATSFRRSGGAESELSPLSRSSGPTGGAQRIEIKDIPESDQGTVVDVRLWATPDGLDAPLRLVATITAGVTQYEDTMTEATLGSQTAWPGPSQPTGAGAAKAVVYRDGAKWLYVRVEDGQAKGSEVDGLALGILQEGAILTADVAADTAGADIRVVIE
jgi:hypothetical protein